MIEQPQHRLVEIYRRLTANDAHPVVAPVLAVLRWSVIFYRQLRRDRAFIRAAALAYASLIALVPMLLLTFGIVRMTGQSETFDIIKAFLFEVLLGNLQPVRDVLEPGVMTVDLGALGLLGVGGLALVSARIYLLVEEAYCDIFDVPVDRTLANRLMNFYLMLTLGPLVIAATLMGTTEVIGLFGFSWFSARTTLLLQFVLLVAANKMFPCTEVRWGPAMAGAAVSATLLYFGGQLFPLYVRWFTSDDPAIVIYGSLGLIPVFLLWLYLLWMFVLLGVEVASVSQRFSSLVEVEFEHWEHQQVVLRVSSVDTALEVAIRMARAFKEGRCPVKIEPLAEQCALAGRDTHQVLRVLERAQVVVRAQEGWTMARRPEDIALVDVVHAWRRLTTMRKGQPGPVGNQIGRFLDTHLAGTLAEAANSWLDEPEEPAEAGVTRTVSQLPTLY